MPIVSEERKPLSRQLGSKIKCEANKPTSPGPQRKRCFGSTMESRSADIGLVSTITEFCETQTNSDLSDTNISYYVCLMYK